MALESRWYNPLIQLINEVKPASRLHFTWQMDLDVLILRIMRTVLTLAFVLMGSSAFANDFCVTGLKGTATSNYLFRITQNQNGEHVVTAQDQAKNTLFTSKTQTQFTQFNSSGYGVCSLNTQSVDESTGTHYKLELKVAPHYVKECKMVGFPTTVEYLNLKIAPKGTTLGDDITAYALSVTPCP